MKVTAGIILFDSALYAFPSQHKRQVLIWVSFIGILKSYLSYLFKLVIPIKSRINSHSCIEFSEFLAAYWNSLQLESKICV